LKAVAAKGKAVKSNSGREEEIALICKSLMLASYEVVVEKAARRLFQAWRFLFCLAIAL